MFVFKKSVVAAFVLLAAVPAITLRADEKSARREQLDDAELDQDGALDRLKRSEFKPLSAVIEAARTAVPGEVVRTKVKRWKNRIAYEFKIITPQGRLREVYIDPASLEILEIE
jgi:uncharacterized membrane protein YkoI